MFSLFNHRALLNASDRDLRHGLHRRELLRIGGLSMLGVSLPALLQAEQARAKESVVAGSAGGTFGRAKNVIFLWLQGGPPQHETFDPKPNAPLEIRGPFQPISTNVPGIQIGELLPRTARIADKLAIVRSLATDDNNHDVSGYWILTGRPYGPGSARQIKPTDWPYLGSIIKQLKPSAGLPALSSVWIPDLMRLNDNVQPAGQTAGFLGAAWEPERFVGDPASADYKIEGLSLPGDIPALRFEQRQSLLSQVEQHFESIERGGMVRDYDKISQNAFGLLTSGNAKQAFLLDREPDKLRDRYGPAHLGTVGVAGSAVDRVGRAIGACQLAARAGGQCRRQSDVGHARAECRSFAGCALPAVRCELHGLDRRSGDSRLVGGDAGDCDRRIRSHAEDQLQGRPRSLGAGLQFRHGWGGNCRRTGLWRQRQDGRLSGGRPIASARPGGDDLSSVGDQSARDVRRSDGKTLARDHWRADSQIAWKCTGDVGPGRSGWRRGPRAAVRSQSAFECGL